MSVCAVGKEMWLRMRGEEGEGREKRARERLSLLRSTTPSRLVGEATTGAGGSDDGGWPPSNCSLNDDDHVTTNH
jgi:hypothetical protein